MRSVLILLLASCLTIVLHSPSCEAIYGKYTMGDTGKEFRKSLLNNKRGQRDGYKNTFDESKKLTMKRLENFLRRKRQDDQNQE